MRVVVALSGRLCNGKSRIAKLLKARLNYTVVDTSDHLNRLKDVGEVRRNLQALGDELDQQTEHSWLSDEVSRVTEGMGATRGVVLDHVRNAGQLRHLRSNPNWRLLHIHLRGDRSILIKRYNDRGSERRVVTLRPRPPVAIEA